MTDSNLIRLSDHHRAQLSAGAAIRNARTEAGLGRQDFADALSAELATPAISADTIRAWEEEHVRAPQSVIDAAWRCATRLPQPASSSSIAPATVDNDDDVARRSLTYHVDATSALRAAIDLGRSDMNRRDAIQRMAYAVGALCIPSRDWLLATLDNRRPSPPRIGMTEVDGMRKIFAAFQEMDVCGAGGDRARSALVDYFDTRIAPLLSQHHAPDVRRALFAAASEHTYLAGWMAYEAANHGLAERYLIQSLRLAEESGDELLGAHVLAGMSDQATLLGHPSEGLRLAQAGQHGLRRNPSSAALADLYTLEARAHAKLGHKQATLAAITQAEHIFDRVRPDNEPEWARFIDVPYLWGEFTNCARDLKLPDIAERFARRSIHESQRQQRARRGALSTYGLAVAQLQRKDLDAACDTAQHAVTLASNVHSARLEQTLQDFKRRLMPYSNEPSVTAFHEHVSAFTR